ncbi:hypothetical protein XENOCAPTIV_000598 [Xenoophorus captivus]|uniref:Secreted protein n=1 Tax=Xenoophorus captivus TaxID=1517983 RepID=A0ABV0QFN5_9TELE
MFTHSLLRTYVAVSGQCQALLVVFLFFFWGGGFTNYCSFTLVSVDSDVAPIITCLMPKSLCLGWSCETGPTCNITTVMVFQNRPFATSGLSRQYGVLIV